MVWVQINLEGRRKLAVASIYANPEGVRNIEKEIGDAVGKFRGKGLEVIVMGDFNARIGLGEERYGKKLLGLVNSSDLAMFVRAGGHGKVEGRGQW